MVGGIHSRGRLGWLHDFWDWPLASRSGKLVDFAELRVVMEKTHPSPHLVEMAVSDAVDETQAKRCQSSAHKVLAPSPIFAWFQYLGKEGIINPRTGDEHLNS